MYAMQFKLFSVLALVIFLFTNPSSHGGGIYKWIDADGNTIYGSKPPENANLQKIKGDISSFTSVSVEPFEYDASLITARKPGEKTVIMYSTSWCGYCKRAARHFRKNEIPFIEHDIEKSRQAARDYKKLNGRGVPVILVGKKRMNGFNAKRFDSMYYGKS